MSNVTHNSVDLTWKQPNSNGGTPLTGYLIEYKSGSRTFWTKSETVNENTLSYTVTKLATDTEYYFRVSALNAEGASKPAETTDAIKPVKKIGKFMTLLVGFGV